MLRIDSNDLSQSRTIELTGKPFDKPQVFTIRNMGAGEELTLLQLIRKSDKFLQKEKEGSLTPEEEDEAIQIAEQTMELTRRTWDDGEGGVKTKMLIDYYTATELRMLRGMAWLTPEEEEKPTDETQESESTAEAQV